MEQKMADETDKPDEATEAMKRRRMVADSMDRAFGNKPKPKPTPSASASPPAKSKDDQILEDEAEKIYQQYPETRPTGK